MPVFPFMKLRKILQLEPEHRSRDEVRAKTRVGIACKCSEQGIRDRPALPYMAIYNRVQSWRKTGFDEHPERKGPYVAGGMAGGMAGGLMNTQKRTRTQGAVHPASTPVRLLSVCATIQSC